MQMEHIRLYFLYKAYQPSGGQTVAPSIYTNHSAHKRGKIDIRHIVKAIDIRFPASFPSSERHITLLSVLKKLPVDTSHDSGGSALVVMTIYL